MTRADFDGTAQVASGSVPTRAVAAYRVIVRDGRLRLAVGSAGGTVLDVPLRRVGARPLGRAGTAVVEVDGSPILVDFAGRGAAPGPSPARRVESRRPCAAGGRGGGSPRRCAGREPMKAEGIFLTHRSSPRIRRHFERLVRESGDLVTWHFVFSTDPGARPRAPFAYQDPAQVLAGRYRAMVRHGGVQGGYLDTLLVPVLRALRGDHVWAIEYDVDYTGRWDELFGQFVDNDADLLTTTLLYRSQDPDWSHWPRSQAPSWVRDDQWVHSLNPLMRISRGLLNSYAVAMADEEWQGHYEYTLPTSALASGARIEDLGNDGPFTPEERRSRIYVGKTPAGRPDGLTFGFRPVRRRYFHESPESFERPGMVYHPVKPGVRTWTKANRNQTGPAPTE